MAIAVVHNDRVVHLRGYGVRKAGQHATVDTGTVFQLASVSKPIAATVMAGLVGDGVIGWDDLVTRYAPGFALADPAVTQQVTLRDMFCHRSGLPAHAGDLLEDVGYDRDAILFRLRELPLDKPLRGGYAYTNFGLTQAAIAAAQAAGQLWEDLARQRLFQPAGMASASFRHQDFIASSNRAWLHVADDGTSYTAKYDRNPDPQSPAGGASANIADMARWLRIILNDGQLDGVRHIAATQLAQTRQPQIESTPAALSPLGKAAYYGLGWAVDTDANGRVFNGHSGGFMLGAATNVTVCVEQRLGIVVLTNAWPVGVAEGIAKTFMEHALDGTVSRDWMALYRGAFLAKLQDELRGPGDYVQPLPSPEPARDLQAYAGNYHNDYYGNASIVQSGDALTLMIGPRKTEYLLRHWNADHFLYEPRGENAVRITGVSFGVPDSGQAERLRVEYLDQNREGDFRRVTPSQS
jgi:CubicO group peptidase (beta-lactamase class C family)